MSAIEKKRNSLRECMELGGPPFSYGMRRPALITILPLKVRHHAPMMIPQMSDVLKPQSPEKEETAWVTFKDKMVRQIMSSIQ